jgi:hypothetical protein
VPHATNSTTATSVTAAAITELKEIVTDKATQTDRICTLLLLLLLLELLLLQQRMSVCTLISVACTAAAVKLHTVL